MRLILLALFVSASGFAQIITGQATRIVDGDTFWMKDDQGQTHKIRFTATDCPEVKQAKYGAAATKHLATLILKKKLRVEWYKYHGDRKIGSVSSGDTDIGLELVKDGSCFYYRQFANELSVATRGVYEEAELTAKSIQLGVWAEPNLLKPWEFRELEKEKQKKRHPSSTGKKKKKRKTPTK